MTDNELFPPTAPPTSYEDWVERCHGLDCLIHDASYTDEEMETRRGWGHSSIGQALQLGLDAGVKLLVLFHHEPDRTDDQLDKIVAESQEKVGNSMKVIAAREGETLSF
jgi:ribonuclease BN (tRNA processing enzyme)